MRTAIYNKLLVASLLIVGALLTALPVTAWGATPIDRSQWGADGSSVVCTNNAPTPPNSGSRRCFLEADRGTNRDWTERCEQRDGSYQCWIEDDREGPKLISNRYDPLTETVAWDPETRSMTTNGTPSILREDSLVGEVVAAVQDGFSRVVGGLLELVALVLSWLLGLVVVLMRGVLGIVGLLVDYVMIEFVIEMGKYITAPESTAIRSAWTMFRDLANIGIIGGLIATAIGTIVGSGSYNASKLLARLILSALLVNFSYFIAGFVIDTSNFVARAAYENIIYQEGCETHGECGIAARFQRTLNGGGAGNSALDEGSYGITISSVVDTVADQFQNASADMMFLLMSVVFIAMTLFVFFSIISFLIARFVALIFILVTSPIGIAGGAVPILKNYSDEWWKALWSQTMFAPVYFLLVGVALNIFDQLEDTLRQGTGSVTALNATLGDSVETMIGTIALFIVGIGLMMTSLNVAKKMAESSERFKQLYDGAKKYITDPIGGFAMRTGLGYPAYWLSQRYPDLATRFRESGFARGAAKIPMLGGLLSVAAKGTDRFIQKRLDATADQKFFGQEGYKSIHTARKTRDAELDKRKKDLDNKDEFYGKGAKNDVAKQKKELLQKKKRLDELESKPEDKLSDKEKDELAKLRNSKDSDAATLDKIKNFEKLSKKYSTIPRLKDGQLTDDKAKYSLAYLRKKQQKGEKLSPAEEEKLKELLQLESLRDEFKIGGAKAASERAQKRHEHELAMGSTRMQVDEIDRQNTLNKKKGGLSDVEFDELQNLESLKAKDPRGFSAANEAKLKSLYQKRQLDSADEKDLIKLEQKRAALKPGERLSAADEARLQEIRDKNALTSYEAEELKEYNLRDKRVVGLDSAERSKLNFLRDERKKRTLKKDELEDLLNLERRDKGLSDKGKENDGAFRGRQVTRANQLGKTFAYDAAKDKWIEEDTSAYSERLDTHSDIKYRDARAERDRVMGDFSDEFFAREYDKDPESIVRYAQSLSGDKWLKIAEDKSIREDIRNKMWVARRGAWANELLTIHEKAQSGEWPPGSPEYENAKLKAYNWQTKNVGNKELAAMIQSNAVIKTYPDGKEVRFKDLLGEGYRDVFWNATSSTGYAEIQKAGILATSAKREAAKSKRSSIDAIRDKEAAFHYAAGFSGDNDWLPNEAGTVQYDAETRAIKAAQSMVKKSSSIISRYETSENHGGVSEAAYVKAVEDKRLGEMLSAGPEKSPFASAIQARLPRTDADRDKTRMEIAEKIAAVTNEDPSVVAKSITDGRVDSYLKGQVMKEYEDKYRNNPNDPSLDEDQRFFLQQKQANEDAANAWFPGKNVDEAQAILNKRNWWSTAVARGMTVDQLRSVDGQDSAERNKLWENVLMYGKEALVDEYMTNANVRQMFQWPSEERMREINVVRVAQGKEPLHPRPGRRDV